MRLSADQRGLLLDAAGPEGAHAIRFYPPIMRLLALGLVEPRDGGAPTMVTTRWRATRAGLELLQARRWIERSTTTRAAR